MRSFVNNSAMPPVAGLHVSVRCRWSIKGGFEGACTPRIPQRMV